MTTVSFDDSTSMTTELPINMKNYSYGLSYDDDVLGFCYEQSTIFELKYKNTGGMLTELQFQITLDTIFEEDWQEQIEVFDGLRNDGRRRRICLYDRYICFTRA